jgi:hypothetical protein
VCTDEKEITRLRHCEENRSADICVGNPPGLMQPTWINRTPTFATVLRRLYCDFAIEMCVVPSSRKGAEPAREFSTLRGGLVVTRPQEASKKSADAKSHAACASHINYDTSIPSNEAWPEVTGRVFRLPKIAIEEDQGDALP